MKILVDTNILVRLAQPTQGQHPAAVSAVLRLRGNGDQLQIVPQVLYEYWSVATRPVTANGLGFSTEQAGAELVRLQLLFALLPDDRLIFEHWKRIVSTYDVKGKVAHDARLVAAMAFHEVTTLLTFNVGDFFTVRGDCNP